jgi:hypothetical protein
MDFEVIRRRLMETLTRLPANDAASTARDQARDSIATAAKLLDAQNYREALDHLVIACEALSMYATNPTEIRHMVPLSIKIQI